MTASDRRIQVLEIVWNERIQIFGRRIIMTFFIHVHVSNLLLENSFKNVVGLNKTTFGGENILGREGGESKHHP